MSRGFHHHAKVEHSDEIFCKLKWHTVKKQLPKVHKIIQDKAQMPTGTVQSYGSLMLRF